MKPELVEMFAGYFASRKEDGSTSSTQVDSTNDTVMAIAV